MDLFNSTTDHPSSNIYQWDMVDFLAHLGFKPDKVRPPDYWYRSPLRQERTPSFKINRRLNVWYDHGIGEGGSLLHFAMKFYNCSYPELMEKLKENAWKFMAIRIPPVPMEQKKTTRLKILSVAPLKSAYLLQYLSRRGINLDIAKTYCHQVQYTFGQTIHLGIGFSNDLGGYEIRHPFFKYSSAPKSVRTFDHGAKSLAVFEGFMDYLSFLSYHLPQPPSMNYLVLNGIGLMNSARHFLDQQEHCYLYLDRDAAGQKTCAAALSWSDRYEDRSELYQGFKDFNEWWMMREDHPRKFYKNYLKH